MTERRSPKTDGPAKPLQAWQILLVNVSLNPHRGQVRDLKQFRVRPDAFGEHHVLADHRPVERGSDLVVRNAFPLRYGVDPFQITRTIPEDVQPGPRDSHGPLSLPKLLLGT